MYIHSGWRMAYMEGRKNSDPFVMYYKIRICSKPLMPYLSRQVLILQDRIIEYNFSENRWVFS